MTRDEYNDKVAEVLRHKNRVQPKPKRKRDTKQQSSLRRSAQTYGKHDKVSTRSSNRTTKVSNVKLNNDNEPKVHENPKSNSKPKKE